MQKKSNSSSHFSNEEKKQVKEKTYKNILWLGIVSIIMMFAGLTSAYIVRRGQGNWLHFEIPYPFYTSTAIILFSSITIQFALISIKEGKQKNFILSLLSTFILGTLFLFYQWKGWSELVNNGIFFVGNPSGSFFYLITGLHILHIAGGMFFLILLFIKNFIKNYLPENTLPIRLCTIYWHFVDILWVYLFLFLVFIR